jgi:signal transduction histidine kinase
MLTTWSRTRGSLTHSARAGQRLPHGDRSGNAAARTERGLANCFVWLRLLALVQGSVVTVIAWSSFRHPLVDLWALVGSGAESAVVIWWCRRPAGLQQRRLVALDVGWAVVGLVLLALATTSMDRTAWVNWMAPFTYSTAAVAAVGVRVGPGVLSTAGLALTYLLSARGSLSDGRSAAATAIANTISYLGFYAVAHVFTVRARRMAAELEDARRQAVEDGRRLATAQERNRQHRLLHDSVLQTMEALAGEWVIGDEELRTRARREARQLRQAIAGSEPLTGGGLPAALENLARDYAGRGLTVELVTAEYGSCPTTERADALVAVAREALTNVAKHAGVHRAVVRLATVGHRVELSVRDHGRGFDTTKVPRGFGSDQSIRARAEEAGGATEIWSAPGAGTRVRVWVPL